MIHEVPASPVLQNLVALEIALATGAEERSLMRNVLQLAGRQVVNDIDLMPGRQQVFCEMGADESSATRNQDFQGVVKV